MTFDNTESSGIKCLQCGYDMPESAEVCPSCGAARHISAFAATYPPVKLEPEDKLAAYKIWAPEYSLWTEWAKPVLFASSSSYKQGFTMEMPKIAWLTTARFDTMVIVDLPGESGVLESLALARLGFRPVPLYNGVNDEKYMSSMLVRMENIADALFNGSKILKELIIRSDAPPVFMLDSNRMAGGKGPGKYDNRWCIFPQDMPSASFLTKQRINKVIVRTHNVQDDLLHILHRYQEQKISILQSVDDTVTEISAPAPLWFKSMFYRFKVILGLTRNSAGGFGGLIPEAQHGGG